MVAAWEASNSPSTKNMATENNQTWRTLCHLLSGTRMFLFYNELWLIILSIVFELLTKLFTLSGISTLGFRHPGLRYGPRVRIS